MTREEQRKRVAQRAVDAWNGKHPVGTHVLVQDAAGADLAAFLRLRDGEEESEEVASLRRQLADETTRANLAEAILRSSPGLSTTCPCARCVRELPPCPTALVCVLCGAAWVNGQRAPEKP